jgi:hypothetical protein
MRARFAILRSWLGIALTALGTGDILNSEGLRFFRSVLKDYR